MRRMKLGFTTSCSRFSSFHFNEIDVPMIAIGLFRPDSLVRACQ
jgi:hypothetical protein